MHTPSPNVGSITTTPKEGVDYTETSDKETPLKIKKLVRKILTSLEDRSRKMQQTFIECLLCVSVITGPGETQQ